jgi:hypothetical protein
MSEETKTPDQEKPSKKIIVGVEIMAEAFNLTDRRIQQLAKDGTLETEGRRGQYDLVKNTRMYVKFLQESYKRPEAVTNLQSEDLKGRKLDNDDRELDLEEKRGGLIPVEIASNLWELVVTTARARIISTFNRLETFAKRANENKTAKELPGGMQEILLELSAIDPADYVDAAKNEIVSPSGENNG